MQTITEETKKKVVKLHIQDGRTIASLAAEYGICHATVQTGFALTVKNAKQMMPQSLRTN